MARPSPCAVAETTQNGLKRPEVLNKRLRKPFVHEGLALVADTLGVSERGKKGVKRCCTSGFAVLGWIPRDGGADHLMHSRAGIATRQWRAKTEIRRITGAMRPQVDSCAHRPSHQNRIVARLVPESRPDYAQRGGAETEPGRSTTVRGGKSSLVDDSLIVQPSAYRRTSVARPR